MLQLINLLKQKEYMRQASSLRIALTKSQNHKIKQ